MIIVRSPLRISLGGGGTDLASYYKDHEGFLIAAAIDKYIYVNVMRPFTKGIYLKYSDIEVVKSLVDIKHPIIRESLKFINSSIDQIEITTLADIPAGTGLGSSSSFSTALLKALYAFERKQIHHKELAELACHVEIDLLKEPIGKQDQYACSVGGINYLKFKPDENVIIKKSVKVEKFIKKILSNSLLIWTGILRPSEVILSKQVKDLKKGLINDDTLKIKIICDKFYKEASKYNGKNFSKLNNSFIDSLNKSWLIKKKLNNAISNNKIEKIISKIFSINKDKLGLKLLGAGAGGFIFVTGIKNVDQFQKKLSKKKVFSLNVYSDSEGSVFL